MVFTSWVFAKFFLVVLVALAVLRRRSTRQVAILCASIFFYGWWRWQYLALLATPSIIDYVCALRIGSSDSARVKKAWLYVSIISNLSLLAYFKYTNFFIDNISALLGHHISRLNIILPIGISFYTFKTLSYTVDVYRGELAVCRSPWKYAMFVTYFPELIAGPIVRASVFLPQMTRSLRPRWSRAVVGMEIVLLGLTKKLVIADRLARFSDVVFANPSLYSPLTVWSGVVAYSLQIYCDFSGYSDMAIGISRIIGFDLPENFNMPYISTSVTEFWRRWHITLSSWLRDYLYIPLGGNRKGEYRTYVNLFVTMLLGGLWHGASWNFVFWGMLHGIALAVHKLWGSSKYHFPIPRLLSWVITYSFICLCWVFFRSADFGTSLTIISKLAGLSQGGVRYLFLPLLLLLPLIIAAHYVGALTERLAAGQAGITRRIPTPAFLRRLYSASQWPFATRPHKNAGIYILAPLPTFWGAISLTLWVLLVFLFASLNTQPFIYFQF
jgi:alginate O-acetyltransferase complex protein AlgI